MSENTIQIPKLVEGKEFYDDNLENALRQCQKEGYEAQFIPALTDARIASQKDATVWQNWYCTPSIKATGQTKQDNPIVVYAHVPNYFSNPDNIKKAINTGLLNGAGIMPEKEFWKLLNLEDEKNVFTADYNKLKNSKLGLIQTKYALEHPQTIPFLGGSERAEKYLKRYEEIFGNKIGVWHSDDLNGKPLGRLLFLGDDYDDLDGCDLGDFASGGGRFVGVRAGGARRLLQAERCCSKSQ